MSKLMKIDKVDKKMVLVALYDLFDLPKSTLTSVLNISDDDVLEIKNKQEYKDIKTTLQQISDSTLSVQDMVDNPREMDIMITTQRFALYKDIQELMKISMDILQDDLYQTKKHLVIQSIAVLTNNLRQLLADMSKPLTSQQTQQSQQQQVYTNPSDVMSVLTASISNNEA